MSDGEVMFKLVIVLLLASGAFCGFLLVRVWLFTLQSNDKKVRDKSIVYVAMGVLLIATCLNLLKGFIFGW